MDDSVVREYRTGCLFRVPKVACNQLTTCSCSQCSLRRQADQLMLVILHIASLINEFVKYDAGVVNLEHPIPEVADSLEVHLQQDQEPMNSSPLAYYHATLRRMLRCRIDGLRGNTFLQLSASKNTSVIGRYPLTFYPSVSMSRMLVRAGAKLHARDRLGRSALYLATCEQPEDEVCQGIAAMLIKYGAHVDQPNHSNILPLDKMTQENKPKGVLSLVCIVARVVKRLCKDDIDPNLPPYLRFMVAIH